MASLVQLLVEVALIDLKAGNIQRLRQGGLAVPRVPSVRLHVALPPSLPTQLYQLFAIPPRVNGICLAPPTVGLVVSIFDLEAAVVALKYPVAGLGICVCCLIVYLRPDPPGGRDAEPQVSS
jgi:hypothetical protein